MLGARLTAATGGIMQATVGVLYLPAFPESLVRRPLLPGQVSAVAYIETIGPLWTVFFLGTALALLAAAVRGKGFVNAHIAAAGISVLYGSCILISAILTEPPVPVVHGTYATFVGLLHICIAIGCRDRGHR
ncbi:hypothetical protein CH296_00340 [Rhodococcus sp. 14-2496-1d]|uniref:hypothetical protein n=1 Tax=Rhodococcus sp. 14-2496-1d TaxID=2023146 RepID=UPI000B9AB363|nr:hypothetical protein [Rhodococcus sp. 14-2496-1d]OZF40740.1 hypothetical protein CH296_00340 [Rhodococcus sp. 14-2496-1d]